MAFGGFIVIGFKVARGVTKNAWLASQKIFIILALSFIHYTNFKHFFYHCAQTRPRVFCISLNIPLFVSIQLASPQSMPSLGPLGLACMAPFPAEKYKMKKL